MFYLLHIQKHERGHHLYGGAFSYAKNMRGDREGVSYAKKTNRETQWATFNRDR